MAAIQLNRSIEYNQSMNNTPTTQFLQAGCSSWRPTNSVNALKAHCSMCIHTYTHTRLTALCPGLPRWASTRKVKPIWILLEQETVSGSGIGWLGNMQVCTSLQTNNHASTPLLSFLQAGCPSCGPTNSVKALKAQNTICIVELCVYTM